METPTLDLLPAAEALPVAKGFDYEQLDDAAANQAKAVVERYRGRVKAYVIDTGQDLLGVKERLDHGLFQEWITSEMGLTPRTAQNFMQAATRLGHKSEIVSHLPPTTLYQLAAPSTPAPVRQQIVERIEAGEPLSPRQIESIVYEARIQVRQERAEAKLTPDERSRRAKSKRDAEARRRREHEKWQREQEERMARKRAIAAELAGILAPLLNDETYRRVCELIHEVNTFDMREALGRAYGPTAADRAAAEQVVPHV